VGQILVRNLDDALIERLKKKAQARGASLEQTLRQILAEAAKPSRQEIADEARRIRERIGQVSGDSTALIREDRDNDEPCR
jgi:plasmid stability protein